MNVVVFVFVRVSGEKCSVWQFIFVLLLDLKLSEMIRDLFNVPEN